MTETQDTAQVEHLRHSEQHLKWRQDHMEALAILKQAEAAIFTHQAHIVAHEVEIAKHEAEMAEGKTSGTSHHQDLATSHETGEKDHDALIAAIRALAPILR